jgi:hypothetical protein
MTLDPVYAEVERVIRRSEVMAVVQALRSNGSLRVGSSLDYSIEAPLSDDRRGAGRGPQNKAGNRYRFAVEQWHLDAAKLLLLSDAVSGPAYGA